MSESPLVARFIASIESGAANEELTYSTALLKELDGDDRLKAIAYLLARADDGDRRAMETLGAVGRAETVEPLRRFAARPGPLGAVAARAVLDVEHRLGVPRQDPAMVRRIAQDVGSAGAIDAGMAAWRLRFSEGRDALDGLLDALLAPHDTTRANANLGLRDKLGLAPLIEPRQAPLFALQMRLLCDLEAVWRPAAGRMHTLLRQLIDGASPRDLGLAYVRASDEADIKAFWASADDSSRGWDLEAYGRLRGHDREWADAYLLAKTWDRDDTPAALVQLGIPGAREALAEAAGRVRLAGFPNPWRDALDALDAAG